MSSLTSSGKFSVIILANGDNSSLFKATGHKNKALIPIHGKPMLDWVIDAFRSDSRVGDITVVGDEELDRCAGMRHVSQRVPSEFNPLQNIVAGAEILRTMIQNETNDHAGYLISFCDAVFLTETSISETITRIIETQSEFHFHYVDKKSFQEEKYPLDHSWIALDDKEYSGSMIYYVHKISQIKGVIETLNEIRTSRSEFGGVLRAVKCEGKSLPEIEKEVSHRFREKTTISISNHAELGMGIDSPEDLYFASKTLLSPWESTYKRGVIIFNPNSGSGLAPSPVMQQILGIKKRKFDDNRDRSELMIHAKEYLSTLGVPVELRPTQSAGHATELAREAVEAGYDLIIAAGGDGTINEVINGMANSNVVLGVLAMGTANVFALEMNIPAEIEAACEVIASGKVTTIDLGLAGDRYFSCMAGTGFDAHVIKKADSKFKRFLGALAYPIVAVREFIFYPFKKITVKLDDQPIPRKGYWIMVSNGQYYGGKLSLATYADMSDGYLDVTIFKYRGVGPALIYLLGIWKNRMSSLMSIEQFQCKKIVIEKGRGASVHVDAEYLCEAPIEIQVAPQALRVAK